jgi:hypothetical protein
MMQKELKSDVPILGIIHRNIGFYNPLGRPKPVKVCNDKYYIRRFGHPNVRIE